MTKLKYHLLGRGPIYVIAARVHIHPAVLGRYVNGSLPIPAHHLAALSQALGIPEVDLQGLVDDSYLASQVV